MQVYNTGQCRSLHPGLRWELELEKQVWEWESGSGKSVGYTRLVRKQQRELARGAPTVCRMGRKEWKPRVDGRVISDGQCCEGFRDWVLPQLCQRLADPGWVV